MFGGGVYRGSISMKAFFANNIVQWVLAALLVLGGVAILVWGPSQKSADAQMRQADAPPDAEC